MGFLRAFGMKRSAAKIVMTALCIVSAIAILLAYFYWHIGGRDPIWPNIIAGLSCALLIAPAAFWLGRTGVSFNSMQSEQGDGAIISFYSRHTDVPWNEIIENACRLDIVVHYYGNWVRDHHDTFVRFFERGGSVRVVMADPTTPSLLTSLQANFFTGHTKATLRAKIEDTHQRFQDAFNAAGSTKAHLKAYYFPQILHYSFVLVDDRYLYLSVYEQFRGPKVRSSVFGIDLDKDKDLKEYWSSNRNAFLDGSKVVLDV